MLFPQIQSSQLPTLILDQNYSLNVNKLQQKKKHFLLSKKIRSFATRTLEDIKENEELNKNLPPLSNDDPNLFKQLSQQNTVTKDFTQFNFGPRFDNNGVVISHSIVGKIDSFMTNYVKDDKKNSLSRIESNSNKLKAPNNERKPKVSTLIDDSLLSNEKRSSLLKPGGPMKKNPKVRLTKSDLLADLNQSIERHNKAMQDDLQTINSLETSDKLYITKQTRILKLFDKYENKWKNQSEFTEKKIQRKHEESVIKNAELYRPKQEAADAFQMTQSDFEKYGDKVWYMTLRLYGINRNEAKKVLYINDLPDGFKKAIIEKRSQFIEKIRKPTQENMDASLLYKTFTSKDYMSKKLEKNQKFFNKIWVGSVKENFEDFQVYIIIY